MLEGFSIYSPPNLLEVLREKEMMDELFNIKKSLAKAEIAQKLADAEKSKIYSLSNLLNMQGRELGDRRTSAERNYEFYKKLLEENPEDARAFLGFIPSSKEAGTAAQKNISTLMEYLSKGDIDKANMFARMVRIAPEGVDLFKKPESQQQSFPGTEDRDIYDVLKSLEQTNVGKQLKSSDASGGIKIDAPPPLEKPLLQDESTGEFSYGYNVNPSYLKYREKVKEAEEMGKVSGKGEITEKEEREIGKERLGESLYKMEDVLLQLRKRGAMPSVGQSPLGSLTSSIRSSSLGQYLGKKFATEDQKLRGELDALTTSVLNDLRSITGLTARQLDSNVELTFQRKILGDENAPIEQKLEAVKLLREKYLIPNLKRKRDEITFSLKKKGYSDEQIRDFLIKEGLY